MNIPNDRLETLKTALMMSDYRKTNLNIIKMEARIRGVSEKQLEELTFELSAGNELTETQKYIANTYLEYKNKESTPRHFTDVNVPMIEKRRAVQKERVTTRYIAEQQKFLYEYPHLRMRREEPKLTLFERTKSFFGRILGYA